MFQGPLGKLHPLPWQAQSEAPSIWDKCHPWLSAHPVASWCCNNQASSKDRLKNGAIALYGACFFLQELGLSLEFKRGEEELFAWTEGNKAMSKAGECSKSVLQIASWCNECLGCSF